MSDKTLTSANIRAIIEETLDRKVAAAATALLKAEKAYGEEVQNSALSGAPCNRAGYLAGVERARTALAVERDTLAEAHRQLAQAIAREEAAARAVAQDGVRDLLAQLAKAGAEADEALALFLGKYQAARRIEREAQAVCKLKIGNEVFGSSLPYVLGEAARHLESLRGGNPSDFEPWCAKWVGKGTSDIKRAAGI